MNNEINEKSQEPSFLDWWGLLNVDIGLMHVFIKRFVLHRASPSYCQSVISFPRYGRNHSRSTNNEFKMTDSYRS